MSIYANNYGEIILLTDEIENNIDKFKASMEHFFSNLIEYHNSIYNISFDIDGESMLKYSCYESTQDEIIKLINDKFSYLLNNDKILLETVKKLENKTIKFRIDYNLCGLDFFNLLATLYDYCPTFEVKAEKEAEHEYFTIFRCKDGQIDYCYSEDPHEMNEGYIEEIEVYSAYGKLYFDDAAGRELMRNAAEEDSDNFYMTYDFTIFENKIKKVEKLLDSLDIENFGYDHIEDSLLEVVLDLNAFILNKDNREKFIATITEIAKIFDPTKDYFDVKLYFWGCGEYYLESYFLKDGEVKVDHLKY